MVCKELKGKTFKERQTECQSGYWCYTILADGADDKDRATEIWADPHGIYCPACKSNTGDTCPSATFMCVNYGLEFMSDLYDLHGQQVVITPES